MPANTYIKNAKTSQLFVYDLCVFKYDKKSNYEIHLLTAKHKSTYEYLQNGIK